MRTMKICTRRTGISRGVQTFTYAPKVMDVGPPPEPPKYVCPPVFVITWQVGQPVWQPHWSTGAGCMTQPCTIIIGHGSARHCGGHLEPVLDTGAPIAVPPPRYTSERERG